tara:strand:+ start:5080 stop:5502 length:423 start_codon:yes stop_codon:yes gene_type:complete
MKLFSIFTVSFLLSTVAIAQPNYEQRSLLCDQFSDAFFAVVQKGRKDQEDFVAFMTATMHLGFKKLAGEEQSNRDTKMLFAANVAGYVAGLDYSSSKPDFQPLSERHSNVAKQRFSESCFSDFGTYAPQIATAYNVLDQM